MATPSEVIEIKDKILPVYCAAAVRAGRFVAFTWANARLEAEEVDTAGAVAHGVATQDTALGGVCQIALAGQIVEMIAGADTTPLAEAKSDNQGRAINHTATADHFVLGIFLGDAAAAGDKVLVQLVDPRAHVVDTTE